MKSITGATELFAIIGDPVAQILSPTLFNAAFAARDIDAVLVPYQVAPEGLESALLGLRKVRNLKGIIVTVPHKIAIVDHVDRLGPAGSCIGAINAIRVEADGSWTGDNFDGAGCIGALLQSGHIISGRNALLIGAGGAGSAVAFALANAGVANLTVCDPNPAQTERLCDRLKQHTPETSVFIGGNDPTGMDLIVNCTPLGMKAGDPLPVEVSMCMSSAILVDVILKPEVSPMLQLGRSKGMPTQTGRAMLEGQVNAVLTFFGIQP